MKKLLLLAAAAVCALSLVSCDKIEKSDLIGYWECTKSSVNGKDNDGNLPIAFYKDGTMSHGFTWKLDGDKLTMSPILEPVEPEKPLETSVAPAKRVENLVFTIKELNDKTLHWVGTIDGDKWDETYKRISKAKYEDIIGK